MFEEATILTATNMIQFSLLELLFIVVDVAVMSREQKRTFWLLLLLL